MNKLFTLLIIAFSVSAFGQKKKPDSVVITFSQYAAFKVSQLKPVVEQGKKADQELNELYNDHLRLADFDKTRFVNHPDSVKITDKRIVLILREKKK